MADSAMLGSEYMFFEQPKIKNDLFELFDREYEKMEHATAAVEDTRSDDDEPIKTMAVEEAISAAVSEPMEKIDMAESAMSQDEEKTPEGAKNPRILQDFGHKIGGARKDAYAVYQRKLESLDEQKVTSSSLSKNWPAPHYDKLLEQGLEPWKVSAIRALRETLPTNGRNRYSWAESLRERRAIAVEVIRGDTGIKSPGAFIDYCKSQIHDAENESWFDAHDSWRVTLNQFQLYEELGHDVNLSNYHISKDYTGIGVLNEGYGLMLKAPASKLRHGQVEGVYRWIKGWKSDYGVLKNNLESFQDVIEAIKQDAAIRYRGQEENLSSGRKASNPYSVYYFENGKYGVSREQKYDWGKAPVIIHNLPEFDSFYSANSYIEEHRKEIDKIWKDMHTVPNERNESNRERSGEKRITEDITPEQFQDRFGFYGVEFGNWVNGSQRQNFLNETYTALLDLADVLKVPPKALSLNGTLSLRFGSNGRGGKNAAAAHYEPDLKAINLTKMAGAGCLAHEWFHALDNYLGKIGRYSMATENVGDYSSEYREELKTAIKTLRQTIKHSDFDTRSSSLDAGKSKKYWGSTVEESARVFEAYVIDKLAEKNIVNDFLANVRTEQSFTAVENNPNKMAYPYPTKQELDEKFSACYDNLFKSIKIREADNKVEMYSCSNHETLAGQLEQCRMIPPNKLSKKELLFQKFSREVMGVGLEFYDGPKTLHGKYDPHYDTIYVNHQSGEDLEWIFYHELFHAMKKSNPQLCNDLMKWTEGSELISKSQIDAYRTAIKAPELSDMQIREEMFADALAEIRTGKKLVHIMENQDKNLAARFISFTKKMAARVTSFFKKEPEVEKIGLTEKQLKAFSAHIEVTMPHSLPLTCLKTDFTSWRNRPLLHVPFNGDKEKQQQFDIKTASELLKNFPAKVVEDTIAYKSPLKQTANYAKTVMKSAKALESEYCR